ncbi:hypothetical protein E2C01_054740 [Portunus trituberculatus]|uniref:Uncharacterized protein n=1 Tax=Portunus trituberculatus TaxID=210409 RepID=A0A5B7GVU0_PORTR|nr:hypothetical protein [Portunus trituberculatus]
MPPAVVCGAGCGAVVEKEEGKEEGGEVVDVTKASRNAGSKYRKLIASPPSTHQLSLLFLLLLLFLPLLPPHAQPPPLR